MYRLLAVFLGQCVWLLGKLVFANGKGIEDVLLDFLRNCEGAQSPPFSFSSVAVV